MTGGTNKNQARGSALCGLDEAGRGPLAGPVVAAAVVLPDGAMIPGLNDSKKLSPHRRTILAAAIRDLALATGLGWVWPEEIDRINILQAAMRAMEYAWQDLAQSYPEVAQQVTLWNVDGNCVPPGLPRGTTAIVRGDATEPAIMAASIIAKTTRDQWMVDYSLQDPRYGFERHKGYPSRAHREALEKYGPCAIHRRSFRGVLRDPSSRR